MYKGGILYSEALRESQKMFVLTVLREQKWNQTKAAETVGVHRNTLRRLVHEFQLEIRSLSEARRRPPERARPLPLEKKKRATQTHCPATYLRTKIRRVQEDGVARVFREIWVSNACLMPSSPTWSGFGRGGFKKGRAGARPFFW